MSAACPSSRTREQRGRRARYTRRRRGEAERRADDDLAENGRGRTRRRARTRRRTRRRPRQRGDARSAPTTRRLSDVDPADAAAEQTSSAAVPAMLTSDVASGIPQMPSGTNARSSTRFTTRFAERDERRDPVRLEAEERAVQHQHRPVERQAERERGERGGDDRRLVGRERAALVDQARQRLGEHGDDDARRARAGTRSAARRARPCCGSPVMSPRDAKRASDGKSTVATATEKTPCGSM